MKVNWQRACILLISVFVALSATGPSAANHGRYLPDVPLSDLDLIDPVWAGPNGPGSPPVEFNAEVVCPDMGRIGEIRFTYDVWVAEMDVNDTRLVTTGAGLAGGFWADENCVLCSGYQWGWVQVVRATFSGDNIWNAPNGERFTDTDQKQDPDYPFEELPPLTNPPNPLPTVGFYDLPNRFPRRGEQFWEAELGLVCKNLATADMKVVATFLWGFSILLPDGLVSMPPGFWSDASTQYINTITSNFSGLDGSVQWQVERGYCRCIIPEPASVTLVVIGLVGLYQASADVGKTGQND